MKAQGYYSHVQLDLGTIQKYSVLGSIIDEFRSKSQCIVSANIICRDHISERLMDEVALCPLIELSLDFQSCRFSTRELVEGILVQTKTTLKALRLDFGALPCIESCLVNHPTLETLTIQAKSSTVQQWEQIVTVLGTSSELREIKLYHSGCLLHNHNLLQHSLVQLVALPKLQVLEMVNIPTIGIPIFRALQHNVTLQKLVITTYRWASERAVQRVAQMLSRNTTLEDLTISATDRASLPIYRALQQSNRALRRLELCRGSGELPDEVTQCLVAMLRENPVLQEVYVSQRTWAHSDITSYLNLNRVRHQLSQYIPRTRQEWIDAIVHHRHDIRVVQFLLSQNPSVCIT